MKSCVIKVYSIPASGLPETGSYPGCDPVFGSPNSNVKLILLTAVTRTSNEEPGTLVDTLTVQFPASSRLKLYTNSVFRLTSVE